jgi:hypothetical protein
MTPRWSLGERDGQGLVKQPDDLSVAAVPVGDLEKRDAVELLQDVEPDHVRVEALDRLEVMDAEDRLSQGFHSWIHMGVRVRQQSLRRLGARVTHRDGG